MMGRKVDPCRSPPTMGELTTQTKAVDDTPITLVIVPLEIVQQAASLSHEL
jgi:hypothetical protein